MKLYVARHGRTDNNDRGVFNGRNDEDINATGIRQAEELREQTKSLPIDLIFCSPMLRTRHTAAIVNCNHLPILYDERLLERDSGEFTLKPEKDMDLEEYWNYYSATTMQTESIPELFARVHALLDEIKEKYEDNNILIITHNGVARAIYAYFHAIPEDGKLLQWGRQKNCEVREYTI